MGTPHKGSDLASFASVIKAVAEVLFRLPPDEIVKDLASNSRHLLELDQLLRFRLGSIDIYSFYELLPVPGLKTPVRDRPRPSPGPRVPKPAGRRETLRPAQPSERA